MSSSICFFLFLSSASNIITSGFSSLQEESTAASVSSLHINTVLALSASPGSDTDRLLLTPITAPRPHPVLFIYLFPLEARKDGEREGERERDDGAVTADLREGRCQCGNFILSHLVSFILRLPLMINVVVFLISHGWFHASVRSSSLLNLSL